MEDIQIDDNEARFYLISLPNNAGFKLCATTQSIDSPAMIGGDPETRINKYWPITHEQLNHANFDVLFPNDRLRSAPLNLHDLNAAFNFDPPFNPNTTPSNLFGIPQQHHVIPPVVPQAIPSHVTYVADFIPLPRPQVLDIYRNNIASFNRINSLKCYIRNHTQNANPHAALSLEQAFELTPQETNNLATCYSYVLSQDLSIEEVKALSEDERQILLPRGSAEIIQLSLDNLREYQEHANRGNAPSNP
jgi:hypothetical protein